MRYQDDAFRREPFMNGTTVATLLFLHNDTSGFRQRGAPAHARSLINIADLSA
jgi:hypothetical protein